MSVLKHFGKEEKGERKKEERIKRRHVCLGFGVNYEYK